MKTPITLVVLALFSMAAYGIATVLFSDISTEMAASIGFSLDEVSLVSMGFTISQILGLILTPLLLRKWGTHPVLQGALLTGIIVNGVFFMFSDNPVLFIGAWLCSGFSLSVLLVVTNLLVLDGVESRVAPIVIAAMLVFSTLLPLGAYPWAINALLEIFDWSLFTVLLMWLFFSAWIILLLYPPKPLMIEPKHKSGLVLYLVIGAAASGIVFLLMRGSYYNWMDSVKYSQWTVFAAVLSLCAVYMLIKTRENRLTATMQLHSKLKTNVFIYNAFIAGFAVSASTTLFATFISQVLHYNSLNANYIQLPAFYAMVLGMLISVLVYIYKRPLSDAIVPIGVVMILGSVYSFSQLPSSIDTNTLMMPIMLRGFGVGLLNVSVSISVLMYFEPTQRIEGICSFYLFRTLGSLIGGAFFSQVIQGHSAQASTEIKRALDAASQGYVSYQQLYESVVRVNGNLPSASMSMNQISSVVTDQVANIALSNALIVFILSIFALAPILIIGKKLAAKSS
ncbi:MAG: MFS transporter [Psychromonas sp.]